jgi:integrase
VGRADRIGVVAGPLPDKRRRYRISRCFRCKNAALDFAVLLEAERRRGTWVDPVAGPITGAEWAVSWWPTVNVAERTAENYHRRLHRHVLPRWGEYRLCDITPGQVSAWARDLDPAGYACSTVSSQIKLLSMMLTDAVDTRLIARNPVRQRRRRGRQQHARLVERVWATPEQVVRIAAQAAAIGGHSAWLLIVTGAWTGARWGELAGLQRVNTQLDDGCIVIDPHIGALHESGAQLWLGPPKTAASARVIPLPPFLIELLRAHLEASDCAQVFPSAEGSWLRRSNVNRRVLRPAVDGNLDLALPPVRIDPIKPGLTFHGLRHSHKTWLIADGVPEIAQARRLGHHLDNRIVETYSHVAPGVERRLLRGLERRWCAAVASTAITVAVATCVA